MSNPLITILLPAYNAEKYISYSIESILQQSFTEFEFIIIDDCSTDGTLKLIEDYARRDSRIIVLKNETNLKLSKTLNRGIDIASGKYVARMDADDWSYPDRLEKQYRFMEDNPEVGISGGSMEVCDEKLNVVAVRDYELKDKEIRRSIFRYNPFSHPLIIMRRSVLNNSGLYNHHFNPAEDYELYFRIGKFSKFANIKDVLLKYRVVGNSMTVGSTRKMELCTVNIRNIYAKEYNMRPFDTMYNAMHYISIFIIPSRLKIWLFNLARNRK